MNNPEKLSYQLNKSGSNLVIIFIMLNMLYIIVTLETAPVSFFIGMFIMYNIALSLLAFLTSTKFMVYKKNWPYLGFVLAIIQVFRFVEISDTYDSNLKLFLLVTLEVSAAALFIGSLISLSKTKTKESYEKSHEPMVN